MSSKPVIIRRRRRARCWKRRKTTLKKRRKVTTRKKSRKMVTQCRRKQPKAKGCREIKGSPYCQLTRLPSSKPTRLRMETSPMKRRQRRRNKMKESLKFFLKCQLKRLIPTSRRSCPTALLGRRSKAM